MFSLIGKKSSQELFTCAFTHNPAHSANLEKTSKISVRSQRSVRSSWALERHFPPPEERMRPPLPASCEPGLTSAALCQLTHAVYLAPWLQWAHGSHSSLAATALWRHQGTFGDTASKAPLLSWHSPTTPATVWDGNYSLPTRQKDTCYTCMHKADQWETHGKTRGNLSLRGRWGAAHSLQLSQGV